MNSHDVDLWLAGLAVLECPMSVEDKVKTLKAQIKGAVGGSFEMLEPLEPTGLDPFDRAAQMTFYRLKASTAEAEHEDIG